MNPRISWDGQQAFRAVLQTGSLSGAARSLGIAQATIRVRIETLERMLGSTLFLRTHGGLVPTDTARELQVYTEMMATASDAFLRTAAEGTGGITGTVRISVSEIFGLELLPHMLLDLCERYPQISIEIQPTDRGANLFDHEADIAVRHFLPTQEQLLVRKLGSNGFGFYAAPAYLDRHPAPMDVADLRHHRLIGPDKRIADIRLADQVGAGLERKNFRVRADSHATHLAALRAGLGIGMVQNVIARNDDRLRRILSSADLPTLGYWIVMHDSLSATPRLRLAFDYLAETIASTLAKDAVREAAITRPAS